jgi:hypothetical protein
MLGKDIYRDYIAIHKPYSSGRHIYIYKNQYQYLLHILIVFSPKIFTVTEHWSMPSVVPGLAPDTTLSLYSV